MIIRETPVQKIHIRTDISYQVHKYKCLMRKFSIFWRLCNWKINNRKFSFIHRRKSKSREKEKNIDDDLRREKNVHKNRNHAMQLLISDASIEGYKFFVSFLKGNQSTQKYTVHRQMQTTHKVRRDFFLVYSCHTYGFTV